MLTEKKEIVLATGQPGDIDRIYVLRVEENHVFNLSDDVGIEKKKGYLTSNVRLVKLKGSDRSYIYVGKTNGANMNGFYLYELRNNKVEYVAGVTNSTGAGEAKLTDLDSDGTYSGYVNVSILQFGVQNI